MFIGLRFMSTCVQESGSLLLWEGNFIKCEIALADGSLPHQGRVFVVLLDRRTRQFITAGSDGFVRWWSFDTIDAADLGEDETKVLLDPATEVFLGDGVIVRGMVEAPDHSHWCARAPSARAPGRVCNACLCSSCFQACSR